MNFRRSNSPASFPGFALLIVLAAVSSNAMAAAGAHHPVPGVLTCPSCDDLNACTVDTCDTSTGTCRHDPLDCDDGNPCTLDTCQSSFTFNDVVGGCFHTPQTGTSCDDGNSCTVGDSCNAGFCSPGTILAAGEPCDDGNACTVNDTCDAAQQCAGDPLPPGSACDDGNACTDNDLCVATQDPAPRCEGTPRDCADSDLCTQDLCDPASGLCTHPPIVCDDGNACTSDVCDPATGICRRDNVAGACSDGNPCTSGDYCLGGNCASGGSSICDDGVACTVDTCVRQGPMCLHSPANCTCPPPGDCYFYVWDPNQSRCVLQYNAGADCTPPGSCVVATCNSIGVCTGQFTIPCADDGNPCTTESCPGKVCAHTPLADGTSCRPSDLCLAPGVCQAGVCQSAGGPCDDQNPCTADTCISPSVGCSHAPLSGVPCDDGSACTVGDTCSLGACRGTAATCDDNNVCTFDRCDVVSGCSHEVQPSLEWCGTGVCVRSIDHCAEGVWSDGACIPGPPLPEVCNGLDDDCDGIIDNAPPLAANATLNVSHGAGGSADLSWPAVPGASGYGVLRGDLVTLHDMGDIGVSLTACLAYDTTDFALSDPTPVETGQGLFFLLRAMNCAGGTWDEGGTGQVASRDAVITVTPADCP